MHTLMLANNSLLNLRDLKPFASLPKLRRLCLIDNNVTKQPNYRLFVINMLPELLVLDFKRVKPAERDAAKALFAEGGMNGHGDEKGPTKEQVAAIKAAIQNATTLEEVNRLEAQLKATGGTDIDASKQGMDLD